MISILRGIAWLSGIWVAFTYGMDALTLIGPALSRKADAFNYHPAWLLAHYLVWMAFGLVLVLASDRLFRFKGLERFEKGSAIALQSAGVYAFYEVGTSVTFNLVPVSEAQRGFLADIVADLQPFPWTSDSLWPIVGAFAIAAVLALFAGPIVKGTPRLWSGLVGRQISPVE